MAKILFIIELHKIKKHISSKREGRLRTNIIKTSLFLCRSTCDMALALEIDNSLLIIGDYKARRLAKTLHIGYMGTIGVLIMAK